MDTLLIFRIAFFSALFWVSFFRGLDSAIDFAQIGEWWWLVAYLATIVGTLFVLYMKVIRPLL